MSGSWRRRGMTWVGWVLCTPIVAAAGTDRHAAHQAGMAEAREALHAEHGGGLHSLFLADRFEYRSDDDDDSILGDLQLWHGGDIQRLWVKVEGEYGLDTEAVDEAEIQALYSRAISTFFDLQIGVRHDLEPRPSRSHAVLGFQGLAPYWFEVDAALFVSDEGDLSARLEAEYDLLLTQRWILQPRAEIELSAADVPEVGLGSGLSSASFGLRLRYEVRRELAPYVGLEWLELAGGTADHARAVGDPATRFSFTAGARFWY